jgi:hypothetical protein
MRRLDQMRAAVAELHSSSESSRGRIAQVVLHGIRLGEDPSATRDGFSVGAMFADAMLSAQQKLKQIARKADSRLFCQGNEVSERALAKLALHYTMQTERDLHEGIVNALAGRTPVGPISTQPSLLSAEVDDLGGNVEFFGDG